MIYKKDMPRAAIVPATTGLRVQTNNSYTVMNVGPTFASLLTHAYDQSRHRQTFTGRQAIIHFHPDTGLQTPSFNLSWSRSSALRSLNAPY